MLVEREGATQVCYGAKGRKYVIEYVPGGLKRPWVLDGETDFDKRFTHLEDAISRAHEIEAMHLGEERYIG